MRSIAKWISIFLGCFLLGVIFLLQVIIFFSSDLPDYQELANYHPPEITRLYCNNGTVLSEYALQRRIYVPISEVPTIVINAFLAAEDKNFFEHQGVDLFSTVRAAVQSILNLASSKRVVGGSTITQQVVKDFLLTNERSIARKVKEAILSYRITKIYSKQRILELYLNKIFLGNNSYGIAAAAQSYFEKDLKDLNIAEAAMLAALPKAPSTLNPFINYTRAKIRRDWVIERMAEEKMITDREAALYNKQEIMLRSKSQVKSYGESFYSETVRQEIIKMFGEDALLTNGYVINTNLDPELQKWADQAFKAGILKYDKQHGWRGPITKIFAQDFENWQGTLHSYFATASENELDVAVVLKISANKATIGLKNSKYGSINLENTKWARKTLKNQTLGAQIKAVSDVLSVGDVIFVSKEAGQAGDSYLLEQVPEVEGGMIVMEPHTGKVLAMVGGYSSKRSFFNRAIQAERQPGSVFKPFVYLAALEQGIQPNSIIIDEPVSISQGRGMPNWSPKNYGTNFLGPITLRTALEKSRNIPTVKLMLKIGLPRIIEVVNRLGIYKKNTATYAMVLGAFETTLMDITNAYNIVASGGLEVTPKFIESIYDRRGNLLYRSDYIVCRTCNVDLIETLDGSDEEHELPQIEYPARQLIETDSNYQFTSLLEGAIKRGTGARAKTLNKTMAGKTGTTNDSLDTWFIGFTPYLTVGTYVGFDKPKTLGQKETGASIALPIFIDFMKKAVADMPDIQFPIPKGIALRSVNRENGEILDYGQFDTKSSSIITEAFKTSGVFVQEHSHIIEPEAAYVDKNLEEVFSIIDAEDVEE